jgi:hypothetical protein
LAWGGAVVPDDPVPLAGVLTPESKLLKESKTDGTGSGLPAKTENDAAADTTNAKTRAFNIFSHPSKNGLVYRF